MDLTTVVGMLISWILVIGGMASGGSLGAYIDIPSLLITIGGTIGAVIISFPGDKLKAAGGVIKSAFVSKEPNLLGMVQTIVSFAEKARREGLLALESDVSELDNEFMKKSIQLVVDGTDPELVKAILDTEIGVREDRHLSNKAVFDTMAELAPAYGMIGTNHSVPRLMNGQGMILGVGSIDYPAEFQGTSLFHVDDFGISKITTLTSTYDHRVIQGAQSGEFLKIIHQLLLGEQDFYDEIFKALRIPYETVQIGRAHV